MCQVGTSEEISALITLVFLNNDDDDDDDDDDKDK